MTMKQYTNEQRYLAIRKLSLWAENDDEKMISFNALIEGVPANTDAEFDNNADMCCAAVEQIDPTVFEMGIVAAHEPLKNLIIGTLKKHEKEMVEDSYFGSNICVSKDDYEDVADEVVATIAAANSAPTTKIEGAA